MSNQLFSNNAIALLKTSITETSTEIEVQSGLGNNFPQPTNPGDYFLITLEDVTPPLNREIIRVTGRNGDILTFSISDRGQENTVPRSWNANVTLVDHRITAATMEAAMLLPTNGSSNSTGPILIEPGHNNEIVRVKYSQLERGNRFWISMVDTVSHNAQTFDVTTVIQGNLNADAEVVNWSRSHRIGFNFAGTLSFVLDKTNKELGLKWHNTEANANLYVTTINL